LIPVRDYVSVKSHTRGLELLRSSGGEGESELTAASSRGAHMRLQEGTIDIGEEKLRWIHWRYSITSSVTRMIRPRILHKVMNQLIMTHSNIRPTFIKTTCGHWGH